MKNTEKKRKKSGYLFALLVVFSLLSMVTVLLLTNSVTKKNNQLLLDEMHNRAEATAHAASIMIPAEQLDYIQTIEDVYNQEGREIHRQMVNLGRTADVMYIYYVRVWDDGYKEYVIDNDPSSATQTHPGIEFKDDSASVQAVEGTIASTKDGEYSNFDVKNYTNIFKSDKDMDSFVSAYAPVYNADGFVSYIAGVDINRSSIYKNNTLTMLLIIADFLALILCAISSVTLIVFFIKKASKSSAESDIKSKFVSTVSHEIRTPLNAIIGMTDIGLRGDIEKKDDAFRKIQTSSNLLLSIVNDVLDVSKIAANKFTMNPDYFAVEETVNSIVSSFDGKLDEKHIRFNYNAGSDIPTVIYADSHRLSQVLMNLIGNAIKFTPEGGTITLETKLLGTEKVGDNAGKETVKETVKLGFAVTDTGIGISPEKQKTIFTPYEQASTTTVRQYGGTGLGLSICRSIIKEMGGSIGVNSQPDKGSCFYFDISAGVADEEVTKRVVETYSGQYKNLDVVDIKTNQDILQKVEATNTGVKYTPPTPPTETTQPVQPAQPVKIPSPPLYDENFIPDFTGQNILVAEDVEINSEIIKTFLEEVKANVILAENGEEAVEIYKQNENLIDAVLMDIHMPKMDGYQATINIRNLGTPKSHTVPIFAMTANVFREDIEKCLSSGMNDHIAKPLNRKELYGKLARALSNE